MQGLDLHRQLPRSLDVVIPAAVLTSIAMLCFIAPLFPVLAPPVGGNVLEANLPPFSPGHLFGTDLNGNDVFSRLLHGGRVSLLIAVSVNVLGLLLGATAGAWAAWRGGIADALVMRLLDILIAFPSIVLVLALAYAFDTSPSGTVLALLAYSVPAYARIGRAATLRLREQAFLTAARLCGTAEWRILARHIGPNILPELAGFGLLTMGATIIIEGALNFLGLGIQPPAPTWGGMIHHGQQALSIRPDLVLLPSLCIFVTVLSLNHLGESLRAGESVL